MNFSSTHDGDTKARLLETALRLFAAHGYEGVTTRALAAEAGANLAAIAYHFGSKRELYRAMLERLVQETDPLFAPVAEELQARLAAADGDRRRLADAAGQFGRQLAMALLKDEKTRWRSAVVMREYAKPSDDFTILYQGRIEPAHRLAAKLAGAALGLAADHPSSVLRAHALLGQAVFFVLAHEVLMRRMNWDKLTPDRIENVAETVAASVAGSLGLPVDRG